MPLYPLEGLKHLWHIGAEEELSFEELLSLISASLVTLPAEEVDRGIEEALRLICHSAGIDESTIYLREIQDPDIFVLSYVLRDPSLPPPPTVKFTAVDNFPWCNKKLIANEIIYLPDTQSAPDEAEVDKANWRRFNVVSALVIPLSTGGGRPLGFWGIDSTSVRREWPQRMQQRLKIIASVFANTLERAINDRQLRESEARLRLAADTAGVGFWTLDVETGVIWATPKLKEIFGLKPEDNINIARFLDIVYPEDRDPVQQRIDAMNRGAEIVFDYRIVPSVGTLRWVVSRGSRQVFAADGRPLLMGITFDITERRRNEDALRTLGARLINAQEEERKHIARELHDDVSQRLALISFGLEQLQDGDECEPAEQRERIEQLVNETQSVAAEIQALSHRLHSSRLDHLGLAAAIRGLCNEISTHQKVNIDFYESNIPRALDPDVALALFRITQESLHNAVKHSGVTDFKVHLQGTRTHVELVIADEGVGFDVTKAARERGLGLISMQERAFALKGNLVIESQPMKGTRVSVRVPLAGADRASQGRRRAYGTGD